jgi:uncharacterized membrane protein YccC
MAEPNALPTQPFTVESLVDRFRGIVAVIVAVLILIGFSAFVWYLVAKADSAAPDSWTRYVYLFGAVEALVFTAVGWLFGREVNRQAVQNAESRVDDATNRVIQASQMAADKTARGEALKAGIEARLQRTAQPGGVEERSIGSETAPTGRAEDLNELATFARTLFP